VTSPIHQGVITALAFLGGADALATASNEGAVVVWSVPAGRPVHRHALHRGPIMALAWDAVSRRLISAGHDRRLVSSDPESGDAAVMGEQDAGFYALAISPNGRQLAGGGYDGVIRLWRLPGGEPLGDLPGHDGAVLDLDFLDDQRLASVGRDYQVVVWDVERRAEQLRTAGHRRWSMRVRASADRRVIYSAGEDERVCAWDATTGVLLWRSQFQSPVWGLERSADGATLLVGAVGLVARLDLGPHGPSNPQPLAPETARAIARSDGGLMALGADSLMLYRADAPLEPLRRLPLGAPNYASVAAVSQAVDAADRSRLAAVMTRASGQVDFDAGGVRRALEPPHHGLAFASCFVPPSSFATVGFDGMIQLRSAVDGALVRSLKHDGFIFSVSASADGSRLLAVGGDAMSLWDTASGERVWAGEGLGVGFHVWGTLASDASFALAVGEGPALHRWDFDSGVAMRREPLLLDFGRLIGTCGLMAIALIDEASAAVATAAGEVRRVDLSTGCSSLLHADHESGVRAMTISPDCRRLLSFSENGISRLYDLDAGRLCTPAPMATAVVPAACFTPDGDLVFIDGAGRLVAKR
jgi:WD40 repeat protein